ncbi:transposase domain-containing protein [Streptomyces sp. NPDC005917]|uniref:transposase domain-containing protein n=1 Tax=unclassified Streptomyces TaxID=2593676 RepID=UPI0033FF5D20
MFYVTGRRAGWCGVLGAHDVVSVGLLARVYPAGSVDQAVDSVRTAPTAVEGAACPAGAVPLVLGLALFPPDPYLEVMRKTTFGLRQVGLLGTWREPAKPSISLARRRLGWEPLRELFARTVVPLADSSDAWAFWRGLRLMAVDGTCVDIADTPANDEVFGRHGGKPKPGKRPHKRAGFPQARVVGLVECGTHAIVDAEVTGCRER